MSRDGCDDSMDLEHSGAWFGPLESRHLPQQSDINCVVSGNDDGSKPLNASFDLSILSPSRTEIGRSNQQLRAAASWDERDGGASEAGRHRRPRHPTHLDMPELPPPTTASAGRGLRGVGSDSAAAEGTPMRLRFRPPGGTARIGKLTPASAKRRKAPIHHLHHHPTRTRSPLHRGAACKPSRVSATGSALTNRTLAADTPCPLPGRKESLAAILPCALETTSETFESSADLSLESSTPFRFTSFPASLPRVQSIPVRHIPPTSTYKAFGGNPDFIACPPTVRKRMSFGDSLATQRSFHAADSKDSSFSSLLLDCEDDQREQLSTQSRSQLPRPSEPIVDPPTEGQVPGTPFPRARLNFSSTTLPSTSYEAGAMKSMAERPNFSMPPEANLNAFNVDELGMQVDGDQALSSGLYEAHAASSFASSVSSMKNDDGMHHHDTLPTDTPMRAPTALFLPNCTSRPQTPREMKLHFHLDSAQCSPIRGIPEEEDDASSTKSRSNVPMPKRHQNASFRLSTSRDSASSDRSNAQRKSRPMPDVTAFEGDGSTSSRDRSFDDSSKSAGSKHPASPKLLCPPTPVRTPAWAHTEAGAAIFKPGGLKRYGRSNSLIATKVLATCSPQVLDGRASLESSLGDSRESQEDRSKSGDISDDESVPDVAAHERRGGWLQSARSAEMSGEGSIDTTRRDSLCGAGEQVSMGTHFDVLSTLGRGTFADVYRVRSKLDGRLYAVKRNRRQFRGTRDREKALAEVKCMQRLQSFSDKHESQSPSSYSLYILFFYQAWQEDGHFFCQTELCCRDTCRDVHESLRSNWSTARMKYKSLNKLPTPPSDGSNAMIDGRLFPEPSIWKVLHDVAAGLSHIHAHGLVHFDIKPSNLFFVPHAKYGAITKIGDFGMAGEIGSSEDGQEGDQMYMAGELLSSDRKHPSADIFSLGLTLFELASDLTFVLPAEGPRWHQLRMGCPPSNTDIPSCRTADLVSLIHSMLGPRDDRPSAQSIVLLPTVHRAGMSCDEFLRDYLLDIDEFDRREEQSFGFAFHEDQTPRHAHTAGRSIVCSPSTYFLPKPPLLSSPEAAHS